MSNIKQKKEIIDLLKSGNFTIAYHDNGHACLYKGRFKYEDLPEREDFDFDNDFIGYIPMEVDLLVRALGGKIEGI